jgi:hypothetical protein
MVEDRRSARRARLTGVRVICESSSGLSQESEVADLSRDGLFIASANPIAVGKRLSLEIQVTGQAAPWAALGRVVWNREASGGDDLPAGMAVKFIDVEESVVAAIDRLIETREPTEPGVGAGAAASADPKGETSREPARREPPRREKTMLGVGIATPASPATPAATTAPRPGDAPPSVAPAVAGRPVPAPTARPLPSREKTMVGVGRAAVDSEPPEPTRVRAPERTEEAPPREVSEAPASGRRSGGRWLLLLALIASGVAGYAFRDGLLPLWHYVVTAIVQRVH